MSAAALLLRRARLDGRVRDVLLAGGRVVAVADDLGAGAPGLDAAEVARAEVVDLDGAVLLPGLRDEHVHAEQWAAARRRIDVTTATSPEHAAALVAGAVAATPPDAGALVLAHGFRDALWTAPPTAAVLDAALPGRAVVVASGDLHTAWCSTAAVRLLGLSSPDGVVREQEAMAVYARAEQVPVAVLDAWVLDAARAAAARGVTSLVDLELTDAPAAWARRAASATPALRVSAAVWPERLEAAIQRGLRSGQVLPGLDAERDPVAAERLRVGPLKVFVDGSLGTRTAWCAEPYPGVRGPAAHGVLRTPLGELERLLRRATAHGLDVAVHAIGDDAVTTALDGFAAAGCTGRIEHAQQVHERDLPRFAALGVVASVQPRHALDDRDAADHHWAGATGRAFPYGALVRAGAQVVLGSDAPVAALDPWDALASAVHRSADDREPWHPEQHLALADALAASSGGRRAVRVGDAADLVVVPEPPADVLARDGADGLRRTPVLGTLVAGAWTHRDLG